MNTKTVSKFLSLVLRHEPQKIGITLDESGWTSTTALLEAMAKHGLALTLDQLREVVATNDKKRFAFSPDESQIRANQGHSVEVELGFKPCLPPEILYHGTVGRFLDSIRQDGLRKGERHHVHLSLLPETALKVGERRGEPVLLVILAGQMSRDGYEFFRSENGVWLTESVPAGYLVPAEKHQASPLDHGTVLYRPVGPEELKLIEEAGWTGFPPRLPDQPIFYPVTNEEYAVQIARDWNVPASGSGHVTRFVVDSTFLSRYPLQQVGGATHRELWIPAEDLEEFNSHLLNRIKVIRSYPD